MSNTIFIAKVRSFLTRLVGTSNYDTETELRCIHVIQKYVT